MTAPLKAQMAVPLEIVFMAFVKFRVTKATAPPLNTPASEPTMRPAAIDEGIPTMGSV